MRNDAWGLWKSDLLASNWLKKGQVCLSQSVRLATQIQNLPSLGIAWLLLQKWKSDDILWNPLELCKQLMSSSLYLPYWGLESAFFRVDKLSELELIKKLRSKVEIHVKGEINIRAIKYLGIKRLDSCFGNWKRLFSIVLRDIFQKDITEWFHFRGILWFDENNRSAGKKAHRLSLVLGCPRHILEHLRRMALKI